MNLNKLLHLCLIILITTITVNKNFGNNIQETDKKMIRPEYLKPGDTIAIVAPSGILNNHQTYIENAKRCIQKDRGLSIPNCPIKVDFEVGFEVVFEIKFEVIFEVIFRSSIFHLNYLKSFIASKACESFKF